MRDRERFGLAGREERRKAWRAGNQLGGGKATEFLQSLDESSRAGVPTPGCLALCSHRTDGEVAGWRVDPVSVYFFTFFNM
ncbi:hypothetical protein R1flu_002227 [Riccia fluitans]|uniref:Uncharacterized protein n=1 Tax=Riccia fluitans TaxID=41844 RepID=A0ABD1Y8V5_9MARC